MRRVLVVLLCALAACAGPRPTANTASRPRTARDGLARARATVVATLARLHFRPHGPEARGLLSEGQGLTRSVVTGRSACTLWLALGGDGLADLDAALYDAEGRRLALDNQPDARPVVGVCGGGRRGLYHRLQAYRGAGPYRLLSFTGPAVDPSELAGALGGQPSIARAAAPTPLDQLVAGARRHGYLLRGPVRSVRVGPELPLVLPVAVRAGTCFGAVVAGVDSPIHVRLLDDRGRLRALDEDGANPSRLMACARRPGSWRVELIAVGAATDAELAWLEAEQADAGDESALPWGTRPAAPPVSER